MVTFTNLLKNLRYYWLLQGRGGQVTANYPAITLTPTPRDGIVPDPDIGKSPDLYLVR